MSGSVREADEDSDLDVESLRVKQCRLRHRAFPIVPRPDPLGNDVSQGQPDQPVRGFVLRVVAARSEENASSTDFDAAFLKCQTATAQPTAVLGILDQICAHLGTSKS